MQKKLILLALLASCAQAPQKPIAINPVRDIASDSHSVCIVLINKIIAGNSSVGMVTKTFDEGTFNGYFMDFGTEFYQEVLQKVGSNKNASAELKAVVKRHEGLSEITLATSLKKLTPAEKKALWNDSYAKAAAEVEEELLQIESRDGDAVATFLLTVPQGEMRANAQEAFVLMKTNNPKLSNNDIIDSISRRMSSCLIK